MRHLLKEALIIYQDRVFALFLGVLSLSSVLGGYDLTSQTSNICNILPLLVSCLFQTNSSLAMFKSCQAMFDLRFLLWFLLLDPQRRQKGSYEIRSVLPSVHLPYASLSVIPSVRKFSRNCLISFFLNLVWC